MKGCYRFHALLFLILGLIVFSPKVRAQGFIIGATASPNPVQVSNALTFTIFVTNGFSADVQSLFVTNTFSVSITNGTQLPILSVFPTNTASTSVSTNSNTLVFGFQLIVQGGIAPVQFTLQPNFVGTLSDQIDVAGIVVGGTTNASTNIAVQITGTTNPPVTLTDLTVSFTPPTGDIFVNDWVTYSLTVSNLNSVTATNVFLTNSLPAGVGFITNTPGKPTISGSTLRFSVGNLPALTARTFRVTVQTTNSGSDVFNASVAAAGLAETNTANNSASMTLQVSEFLTNDMVASISDPTQTFNGQVSLMEQGIILSNASSSSVLSSRVIVSGLRPEDRLVNAVGTNNALPFVVHGAPLAASESVRLLLQFRVPSHLTFPLDDSNLDARAITAVDLTPPANLGSPVPRRMIPVPGQVLLEFPSTNGQSYIVLYSDAMGTNTGFKLALPSITASANVTYWFDYGPPATVTAPGSTSNRFYQIFLKPPP